MSQWTAYAIIPIDYGWEFLPTVADVAAQFAKHDAAMMAHSEKYEQPLLPIFWASLEIAKQMAEAAGWEGDYFGGRSDQLPRVFFLPKEGEFDCAFAWKQSNNGTTFIVSPYPLPWLNALG